MVQQRRHELRVLGEAADLLLGVLAAGVVGHKELAQQHLKLVHGAATARPGAGTLSSQALLVSSAAAAAAKSQILQLCSQHRTQRSPV